MEMTERVQNIGVQIVGIDNLDEVVQLLNVVTGQMTQLSKKEQCPVFNTDEEGS